jgi:hypothetical protein
VEKWRARRDSNSQPPDPLPQRKRKRSQAKAARRRHRPQSNQRLAAAWHHVSRAWRWKNDVQTTPPFHLALPKFERSPPSLVRDLRYPFPIPSGRRSERSVARDVFCTAADANLQATHTTAKRVRRTQKWHLRSTSPAPDFVIKIRVETSAAAAEMTEGSHLLAGSAALPKCFRQHRLPQREVLRPLENELRTADNATVGDAECISQGTRG